MHSKRVMKKKDTNILKNTKPDTNIPLELKPLLTLKEASVYTGIGINKLRDMSNEKNCDYVLFVGRKRMFKREALLKNWTTPTIYAVVYNVIKSDTVTQNGLLSIKGDSYGVKLIGSLSRRFSLSVIEQLEMEEAAIECHTKWSDTEAAKEADIQSFEKYEYYRTSSRAEAVYAMIRRNLGIDVDQNGVTLEKISEYEHMRWNAYMRSEGYVYGEAKDYVAKTHPDLKSYWELPLEERKKTEEIVAKSLAKERSKLKVEG